MERRKVQLDNQPVDFTSFMADLENLFRFAGAAKGLAALCLSRRCRCRTKVITDGTSAPDFGVEFDQQCGEVYQQARRCGARFGDEGDMLHFEVKIPGSAFRRMSRIKIFAMYYQVKDSTRGNRQRGPVVSGWQGSPVGWRKIYGRRYYRFQSAGQRIDLYANGSCASGGGREAEDAFEDDMPCPRCMFCWSKILN